jgi:catechol 2,3-dioxygenase-like lactoylglutathione lyase family enzyme
MPGVNGVLETALYVEDVNRAAEFYRDLFDFEVLVADDRLVALGVAGPQVLLLFRKGASASPAPTAGGVIPPHDGQGSLHLAFAISGEAFAEWERCLVERGVAVESVVRWPRGGRSLYFRDPDGNLVELATPGTWAIY